MLRTIWRVARGMAYQRLRQVVRTLTIAPPFMGLLIFLVLSVPAQLTDLYLGLWEDDWTTELPRGIAALAGLMLVSALLAYWHLFLARPRIEEVYAEYPDVGFHRNLTRIALGTTLALAALPGLGVLLGLWSASRLFEGTCASLDTARVQLIKGAGNSAAWLNNLAPDCQKVSGDLRVGEVRLELTAMVVAIAVFALLVVIKRRHRRRRPIALLAAAGSIAAIAVLGPMLTTQWFTETGMRVIVDLGWRAGPMAALMIVLTSALITIMGLSWISQRTKVPVLLFLVLLGALFAAQGLQGPGLPEQTDNRQIAPDTAKVEIPSKLDLKNSFADWLDAKKAKLEKKAKQDRPTGPYQVYIFAAEGGGIYAASAIALYLSSLQDQCDEFADHVFAISGVSGGAIGATLFDAMLSGIPHAGCDTPSTPIGAMTKRAGNILHADHLSPLLAFVLPDIIGKDLPIASTWDRAKALEWSFNCAFETSARPEPSASLCGDRHDGHGELMSGFGDYWRASNYEAPALVLNTTWVETGYRVAFAPRGFKFETISDGTLMAFSEVFDRARLSAKDKKTRERPDASWAATGLIQAAVASARFPLIEPPWSPQIPDRSWNFVDGGYVDNSGTNTALDLYKVLDPIAINSGAELHLIVLTDKSPELRVEALDGSGFRDIVAPIAALLNVRGQLANRALTESRASILALANQKDYPAKSTPGHKFISLDQRVWALPLGWKISKTELDYIRLMLGSPELCESGNEHVGSRSLGLAKIIYDNSCATKLMLEHIRRPANR